MLRFLCVALEIHPLVLNKSTTGCVHKSCTQPEATLPKIHWACTAWEMIIVTKDKANEQWFSLGNKAALLPANVALWVWFRGLPEQWKQEESRNFLPPCHFKHLLPFQWNACFSSSFPATKPGNWEIRWAKEAPQNRHSPVAQWETQTSLFSPQHFTAATSINIDLWYSNLLLHLLCG